MSKIFDEAKKELEEYKQGFRFGNGAIEKALKLGKLYKELYEIQFKLMSETQEHKLALLFTNKNVLLEEIEVLENE